MDCTGRGLRTVKRQAVGPKEAFARSQLVCYFIDFHGFHKISGDFMDFHGFQGSAVGQQLQAKLWTIKKPLLDPSWLAISSILIDFTDFHKISCISIDFKGRRFADS